MKLKRILIMPLFLCFCVFGQAASGQTTAFTYQGLLRSSSSPANGNFDFEFKLFDLVSSGAQQGSTIQRLNVAVTNGVFTVSLDFGAPVLPGTDRFLDIAVRASGGGAFTPLTPRQQITSAPYSVRSLNSTTADVATNATQLGGVAANQFVTTSNGGTNFIQNTTMQQTGNFNISGNGVIGGNLTVTGAISQPCPAGYVSVGPKLCAEIIDQNGLTFSAASARCIAAGGHLMTSTEVRTIIRNGVILGGGVLLDWLADRTAVDSAMYVNNASNPDSPEGTRATSTSSYGRCMINLP